MVYDYTEPFTDENGQNAGGGKLTLAFGVMGALDTCVDSYLDIFPMSLYMTLRMQMRFLMIKRTPLQMKLLLTGINLSQMST